MAQTFSASVDAWVMESKRRMMAVFQTALQYTVEEVIDRTPVDTGFLRASFKGSDAGFAPVTQGRGIAGGGYSVQPYALVIAGLDDGDTFYGNFTANYAVYVENGSRGRAGRHMVKLAAQNWQVNVNRAVAQIRKS